MKKIAFVVLLIVIVSFVSMILNFLALNDIAGDYVSKTVLQAQQVSSDIVAKLPDWSECKTEWNILKIDLVIRALSLIGIAVFLIKYFISSEKK